jgi:simple sugar transport system ATP-binding protein
MPARPRDWVRAGVARIPEDRHAVGVVGDLPLWENAVLERVATPAFSRTGVVKRAAAQAHARQLIERFDVRGTEGAGLDTPTRALSGGNMQKLILGRALMGAPRPRRTAAGPSQDATGARSVQAAAGRLGAAALSPPRGSGPAWGGPALGPGGDPGSAKPPTLIVADQPTWGLDIGAVAYVHQQLLDACAAGAAVLLISEDLDEIFALADRIAVLHDGRLSDARPAADWTLAGIGLAMAGSDAQSGADHAH